MADDNSIVMARSQAKALGLKMYVSGKPCVNGHVSKRYVSNNCCTDCSNLWYHRLSPEDKKARSQRLYGGRKKRIGVEVLRAYQKSKNVAYREKNKDRLLEYGRQYYASHREQNLASNRRWRKNNPVRVAELDRIRTFREYGISADDYDKKLEAQNGCCAICRSASSGGRTKVLSIDHDHATGLVRGLLCGSCNLGIGKFADDPERLVAAAEYLKQWRVTR